MQFVESKIFCYIIGENTVTISTVLPTLALVRRVLPVSSATGPQLPTLVSDIRKPIIEYLARHFGESSTQAFNEKASFLDPRYKTKYSPDGQALVQAEAELMASSSEYTYTKRNLWKMLNCQLRPCW